MSPRILFVDHTGVLGGGELSLLDIARHFRETSKAVLFEEGPFRDALRQAGVAVEVMHASGSVSRISRGGGLLQDLKAIPGVLKMAWRLSRQARDAEVIYANSQKSMILAALAGALARRPVIWHLRDVMTADHFSPLHCRVATTFANRFVARVIANSNATRAAFVESGGRRERVVTVHNGISDGRFKAVTSSDVARLRQALRLDGAPVVGVFSRLAPWKGQHVLLEALKDLPGVHALLVGEALFREDEAYAESLRRQAVQLGLAERVHFLGFRHDVPQLLLLVDVVVHTSIAPEPFGRVIVEGMLASKPVVATRAGGALEILEEEKTGFLVPPGEPQALAAMLARLLAEPDTPRRVGRAGRQAARERFSVEGMLAAITRQVQHVATPG